MGIYLYNLYSCADTSTSTILEGTFETVSAAITHSEHVASHRTIWIVKTCTHLPTAYDESVWFKESSRAGREVSAGEESWGSADTTGTVQTDSSDPYL